MNPVCWLKGHHEVDATEKPYLRIRLTKCARRWCHWKLVRILPPNPRVIMPDLRITTLDDLGILVPKTGRKWWQL